VAFEVTDGTKERLVKEEPPDMSEALPKMVLLQPKERTTLITFEVCEQVKGPIGCLTMIVSCPLA